MRLRVPTIATVNTGLVADEGIEARFAALPSRVNDWLVSGAALDLLMTSGGKIASFASQVTGGDALNAEDATDRATLATDATLGTPYADFSAAIETDRFAYEWAANNPDFTAAHTFPVFFRPTGEADQALCGAWDSSTERCAVWLFDSTKVARFLFGNSSVDATGTYVLDAWNMLVCSYDGSGTIKAALNGAAFASQGSVTEAAISSKFVIGDSRDDTEQQFYTGDFKRLAWYDADLSGNSTAYQVWKDYFTRVLGGTLAS